MLVGRSIGSPKSQPGKAAQKKMKKSQFSPRIDGATSGVTSPGKSGKSEFAMKYQLMLQTNSPQKQAMTSIQFAQFAQQ